MKIAISTDSGQVSGHFGRCPEFSIVEIESGKIINRKVVANPGHVPGALPRFLSERGVSVIIAGGMGPRAQGFFQELGIEPVAGVSGPVDEVIRQFLAGSLRGGESLCQPGAGRDYGLDKNECDHEGEED